MNTELKNMNKKLRNNIVTLKLPITHHLQRIIQLETGLLYVYIYHIYTLNIYYIIFIR